jgi:phosphoglycolate phosphatase
MANMTASLIGNVFSFKPLKALGVKQAIVTNKESRFSDRILLKHGLAETFDMVVSGDTLKVKKPDPAVLFYCVDSLWPGGWRKPFCWGF